MAPLWYRCWLQLRFPFGVCAAGTALVALGSVVFARVVTNTFRSSGRTFVPELLPRFGSGDPSEAFLSWAIYTVTTTFLIIFLPGLLLAASYGRRPPIMSPFSHASIHFTLSLPQSRRALVAAWLASSGAALTALFVIGFAVHALGALALGLPVPLGAMARTAAMAVAGAIPVVAALGFFGAATGGVWTAPATLLVAIALHRSGWDAVLDFVAGAGFRWTTLAGAAALTSAAFAATVLTMRKREA